ncbi:MAG TPA: dihydrofolate synthase [Bacteroidales bacterium]|nr:MAG: hypothetical protein A2X11_06410 [Bacteroidetes bacterium GWE2_42_24]OFY25646.1 MAG: hypothetical protein A2X09_01635 [Bacteroidetes bacterium GWF2_43_11]HAQ65445.1 dihydrofolate synthase [Bacteroidales bacterium]HBZ68097.1 dihydrofolate synthase [Bacteroidales bacterium]
MTYSEALEYMYNRLPMFQRIGAAAYKADLSVTVALCRALGNPQVKFPSVHIAGTNGKGSVSHITASVLRQAGYRTGLFTSPHLRDYRERMRINGVMIPEQFVTRFVEQNIPLFEKVKPSFFEMTFAMACEWFASEKIEVAVMETGMGGRLDSTNTCRTVLSVITNISPDHMQFLGDTLPKIAAEKAGIIRSGIPVIIGQTQKETDYVFTDRCRELNSRCLHADQEFEVNSVSYLQDRNVLQMDVLKNGFPYLPDLFSPLPGSYQIKNIITAVKVNEMLPDAGFLTTIENFRKGLERVIIDTGITGRWQKLGDNPSSFCDTGHNEDGIRQVLHQLSLMHYRKLHFVIGMVADKDINHVLSLLPEDAVYYFCRAGIPRALAADALAAIALTYGLKGTICGSVDDAYRMARENAGTNDIVLVGGSTFVVAEVV